MANKHTFSKVSSPQIKIAPTNTTNPGGGKAYALPAEAALAQLAVTGTFNDTYYEKGADQLEAVKKAADGVSPLFLAQTAIWAREKGYMKDMPVALVSMLSKADPTLFHKTFDRVVDNGKQLRTFVQMIRSGAFGRKSLGSGPKRAVRRWLEARSDGAVFRASIGQNPSLSQIIKLAHPKPSTPSRRALYGYLRGFTPAKDNEIMTGHRYRESELPVFVRQLEQFRRGETDTIPDVDYRFLEGQELPERQAKKLWTAIARRGQFMQTFKNLNNYLSRGLFNDQAVKDLVVSKLKDKDEIRKARVLPFQLLAAWIHTDKSLPSEVREALQDSMEVATENVPSFTDEVLVMLDVSGSMNTVPVTGRRKGASSKVMCNQAAALIASAVLRQNRSARVIPFDTGVHSVTLNPRDSVMTNAAKLTLNGGGTACSVALEHANKKGFKGGLVLYLSDNASWADAGYEATGVMSEWKKFKAKNPNAKMVCLNLQSSPTTQAVGEDVLNLGGFSDEVWKVISDFVAGKGKKPTTSQEDGEPTGADTWIAEIKSIDLDKTKADAVAEVSAEVTTEVKSEDEDEDA